MDATLRNRHGTRASSTDYLKHWKTTKEDKDDEKDRKRRQEHYDKLANDFYDNSTDFYLEGWGQSFHFCRYPRGREPMPQAMARHEHYMAHCLNLTSGMTVLDVGCGIGGPAKEIATFVDCKVVGLNINDYQIEKGREIAKAEDVGEEIMELVKGDFMTIPYSDDTFDAVYAIEATVHAPSLASAYAEIFRVLKPGARFGVYEWIMMADKFDPLNSHHAALRYGMERGNGIASIRTSTEAQDAMKQAGFVIEVAEDLAAHHDALPWWYFCAGDTKYAQGLADCGRIARMTAPGRVALDVVIRMLELVGVARKGTATMAKEMIHGGDCIAEAGRNQLFTPMYFMVGRKPSRE